jgi:hypothetical protein
MSLPARGKAASGPKSLLRITTCKTLETTGCPHRAGITLPAVSRFP